MEDPKKDYELLMQYLQGDPAKKQAASVQDSSPRHDWKPAPQATRPHLHTRGEQGKRSAVNRLRITKSPLKRRLRLLIGGLALIVFIVLFIKVYSYYTLTPESLYAQLYKPYQTAETASKNSIATYYNAGNFVAATLQAKKQAQLSDEERLIAGLAYLQRNDYASAIKWLEPVAHNFKNPYRQPGEYYLSLAYLKNGDFDRSIETMERIHFAPAHPYKNVVTQDIIADLKMLKWK